MSLSVPTFLESKIPSSLPLTNLLESKIPSSLPPLTNKKSLALRTIHIQNFPACAPECASVSTSCLTTDCALASQGLVLVRMCQNQIDMITCKVAQSETKTFCTSIDYPISVSNFETTCGTTLSCDAVCKIPIELLVGCPTCTTCPVMTLPKLVEDIERNPQLVTYSKGGYAGKGTPGTYFLANFKSAFPAGLFMGSPIPTISGFYNRWTVGTTAQTYLKTGATPGILTSTATNPTSNNTGTFGSNLLSLIISVGLDANNATFAPATTILLGNVILNFPSEPLNTFNDLTVSQFILGCNYRIGSVLLTLVPTHLLPFMTATASLLNNITTAIIENYDNGTVNNGHLKY